jgi:hypothetical protein
MTLKKSRTKLASTIGLLGSLAVSQAQTVPETVNDYLSRTISEIRDASPVTIRQWSAAHPGETIESPQDRDRNEYRVPQNEIADDYLEGRWCLRSTIEVTLADNMVARRIAVFYPPRIDDSGGPFPPLPSETGAALREEGCKLDRVFLEIDGVRDPEAFAAAISIRIPGRLPPDIDYFPKDSSFPYWKHVYVHTDGSFWFVYSHPAVPQGSPTAFPDRPGVLLEWDSSSLQYSPPSADTVDPLAGQPWLALRAAVLARLPEGPTLSMLSFLAPRSGQDWLEQPPLYCHRQLIPVMRNWLALAARAQPNQHAAAIVLADQVARNLSDCVDLMDVGHDNAFDSQDAWEEAHRALEKDLKDLGIDTFKPATIQPEQYTGNLLAPAGKLASTGAAAELYRVAVLEADRCDWPSPATPNCADFIKEGEDFLSHYPNDEWTPGIRLLLAEAYSITLAQIANGDARLSASNRAELEKKLLEQLRAWYASSRSERDLRLVWNEIWRVQAGMGPWLMLPEEMGLR